MSVRLTNKIRSQIITAVSNAKFDHLIDEAERAVTNAIKERMDQSQAASLPRFLITDGWIAETDAYTLREFFTEDAWNREKNNECGEYELHYYQSNDLSYPKKGREYRITLDLLDFDPNDALAKAYKNYRQIRQSKRDFCSDVDKIVSAVTTVPALLKLMPELEPYIPSGFGLPDTRLIPTGLIDKVRNILQEETL